MTRQPYPYNAGAPECSTHGCCLPANPHNPDGLCAVCEREAIERQRRQWASSGRVGLGATLWMMSTRDEWLDDDDGDEE